MRDCFVIFDNLIKDGIIARSIDGDKTFYKASNQNELLNGGVAASKYVYSSDKLNTSSLPSISLFLCQVISVYGISLSLKTLVSLQLYCMRLAYAAASECHILHFRKSLNTFDQAIHTLHNHAICKVPPYFCVKMSRRTKLKMRIKSMQARVEKYLLAKSQKTKGLDLSILKADVFKDFPPEL